MKIAVFFLLIWSLVFSLSGQTTQRFFLRPVIGIQGAQIDGDYYAGYDQAGIFAGALTGRNVTERLALSMGLAFSQKGARQNADPEKNIFDYYRARLNYVELPLHITFTANRYDLYAGAYYARLINSKEENQNGPINTGIVFKKNDIGYLLGGDVKIHGNFRAGARFAYSLIPIRPYFFNGQIYYHNFLQRLFNRGLYNNTLTFYAMWNISPGSESE